MSRYQIELFKVTMTMSFASQASLEAVVSQLQLC